MIIDGQAHMNHVSYLEWLSEKGGAEGKRRAERMRDAAKRRPAGMNVGERLAMMDRNNIDFQVVTPDGGGGLPADDPAAALTIARVINDGMMKLREESNGRLIAGGTVPLTDFKQRGSKEMTRAVKDLGLKAITIPSSVKGQPLDTPVFEPFWAQAAELDVPIYIHPNTPEQHRDRVYEGDWDLSHVFGMELDMVLFFSRLVFSGIMDRYPTLKVVGHHLGGGLPFWLGRVNETYDLSNPSHDTTAKNVRKFLTKPLLDYFSLFYYDTAVGGSGPAIRCAYEVVGADQILLATDAPHGPGSGEVRLATYPKVIKSLGLPEADTEKILAGTAKRLLNLELD
ncbi:amidohydrolase family protein [Chloroflexota bacterium]